MKRESREIVKVLAIGLAVMMALPLAYRVWEHFHPSPVVPRKSLTEYFARAAEGRAVRLLQTPLSKWTDFDRESEPRICAWLEAHARQVLPWEWTDEARRKDPDGYRKLWRDLFEEQREALVRSQKDERAKLEALKRKLWIAEMLQVRHTNRLFRAVTHVATNSFQMRLGLEELAAQVKSAGDRVASVDELITRNEAVSKLDEVNEPQFLSETCRFLNMENEIRHCQ